MLTTVDSLVAVVIKPYINSTVKHKVKMKSGQFINQHNSLTLEACSYAEQK